MERFETRGLQPPPVAAVAFNANLHGVPCSERNGLTLDLGDTAKVFLCSGQTEMCEDDACTSFTSGARLLMLRELAHAWMNRHVGEATRQAFLAHMGLEEWYSPELDWGLRGMEQAAETLAWGLMDEPIQPSRLGTGRVRSWPKRSSCSPASGPSRHCACRETGTPS